MNKVCVLMSSYNGESYIIDQIESIYHQIDCDVYLLIRDDGSEDKTTRIIETYSPNIQILKGENVGYKKSFMSLLLNAPSGYDFYAFSDQDDIWLDNKLSAAITQLNKFEGPAAYCSKPIYVDEKLNRIQGMYSNLDEIPSGVIQPEWAISTGLIALGCTFVWNNNMQRVIKAISRKTLPFAHDNYLSVLCPMVGTLYKDADGYILYRQHVGNASGDKKQNKYSFTRAIGQIKSEMQDNSDYRMRKFIYDNYSQYIPKDRLKILEKSLSYKKDMHVWNRLLIDNYAKGLSKKEEMKFYWHVISKTL